MTVRVFGEANLRLLVMGPGETFILHCVISFQGHPWNMQPQCYSQVKHFSFKIKPAEGIMPIYHECGCLKQNWTHYPTFSHVAKVKAIDKKSEHPKMQRQDFKAGLSNSASFWRG